MKKIVFLLAMTLPVAVFAQTKTTTTKPAAKPVAKPATPAPPLLKTLSDSASYAVGVSVASFYKQQGISKLNSTLVTKAMSDVFGGKKTLLDENVCNTVMNSYINKMQEQKSKATIDSGTAFLKKNKTRPEIKTSPSGLQYEVITEGTGEKPTAVDSVTCHYKGTLLDGTPFDDSYSRGQPITFALNRVIPGWTEGLQYMSVGSKYKFYIPHNLGYGIHDYGPIPGGSMLTFVVELLEVKKAKPVLEQPAENNQ